MSDKYIIGIMVLAAFSFFVLKTPPLTILIVVMSIFTYELIVRVITKYWNEFNTRNKEERLKK